MNEHPIDDICPIWRARKRSSVPAADRTAFHQDRRGTTPRRHAVPTSGARRRPHAPDHRRMPRFHNRFDALGRDFLWAVVPEFRHERRDCCRRFFPLVAFFYNGLTVSGWRMATPGMKLMDLEMRTINGEPTPFINAAVCACRCAVLRRHLAAAAAVCYISLPAERLLT